MAMMDDTIDNNDSATTNSSDVTSGYRYALTAYADTISPALSNEDGMGGGGGTLRSRSGRVRGSAGSKTSRGNLIPVFEDHNSNPKPPPSGVGSSMYGDDYDGVASSAGGVIAAALSPTNSVANTMGSTTRQDRFDAYEQLMGGGAGISGIMAARSKEATTTTKATDDGEKKEGGTSWAAIPEEPRNSNLDLESGHITEDDNNNNNSSGNNTVSFQQGRQSQQRNAAASSGGILLNGIRRGGVQSIDCTTQHQNPIDDAAAIHLDNHPTISLSPSSHQSYHLNNSSPINDGNNDTNNKENQHLLILQPDAIYQEHYGDAYVDQLIKYLYPAGYQSMRPRSGPWKLSIFIFLLFLWLSVFIVGHCYDRGQREYTYYFDNADDAYLQEVDDDMLVMETRWCGSKPLYFTWLVSVWIAVLSMSYCSIIGYVKVRDIAVANARSQPAFGGMGVTSNSCRSDYYVMVENANVSGTSGGGGMNNVAGGGMGNSAASAAASGAAMSDSGSRESERTAGGYSSYQDGSSNSRRYAPSIYQSDGTPVFWGGHIYRPTQAAVAMTNRP